MDESVYALVKHSQAAAAKPAMYKSKFKVTPPTCSTFGIQGTSRVCANVEGSTVKDSREVHPAVKANAGFGKSVAGTIDPHQFLKCGTGAPPAPSSAPAGFARPAVLPTKAAVPKRDEKPVMGLKTDKNFVVSNAVETILTAPRQGLAASRKAEDESAAVRRGFGEVPTYLNRVKGEIKAKQEAAEKEVAAVHHIEASKLTPMSDDEVVALRTQLKQRLLETTKQFQALSFTLETRSQLKRKEMLEQNIRDLELGIAKLSRKHVLIREE